MVCRSWILDSRWTLVSSRSRRSISTWRSFSSLSPIPRSSSTSARPYLSAATAARGLRMPASRGIGFIPAVETFSLQRSAGRKTLYSRNRYRPPPMSSSPRTAGNSPDPAENAPAERKRPARRVQAITPSTMATNGNLQRIIESSGRFLLPCALPASGASYHDFRMTRKAENRRKRCPRGRKPGPPSENGSDRKVPFGFRFSIPAVELPSIVQGDRPNGGHVPEAETRAFPEVEAGVRDSVEPHASGVDEQGHVESVLQREPELRVEVHHVIPADGRSVSGLGAERFLLEPADRRPPPEEEPLLDRDFHGVAEGPDVSPPPGHDERVLPEDREIPAGLSRQLVVIDLGPEIVGGQLGGARIERSVTRVEGIVPQIEDGERTHRRDVGTPLVFRRQDGAGRHVEDVVPRDFVLEGQGGPLEEGLGDARDDAGFPEAEADALRLLVVGGEATLPFPPVSEDPGLPQVPDVLLLLLAGGNSGRERPPLPVEVPVFGADESPHPRIGSIPRPELDFEKERLLHFDDQIQDPLGRPLYLLDPYALVQSRPEDRPLEFQQVLLSGR